MDTHRIKWAQRGIYALATTGALALTALGFAPSADAHTPVPTSAPITSSITSPNVQYAFYSTDTGTEAPTSEAPYGWMYKDNTDFEDDHPKWCDTSSLTTHVTAYLCSVPRNHASDDQSYDVKWTDDGDLYYTASGDVLDPIFGGPVTPEDNRPRVWS